MGKQTKIGKFFSNIKWSIIEHFCNHKHELKKLIEDEKLTKVYKYECQDCGRIQWEVVFGGYVWLFNNDGKLIFNPREKMPDE